MIPVTLKPYLVKWHTTQGYFLRGVETVFAESQEEASQRAREDVHDRAFPDLPLNRIIITETIEMKR
jgi:hypothetical protein